MSLGGDGEEWQVRGYKGRYPALTDDAICWPHVSPGDLHTASGRLRCSKGRKSVGNLPSKCRTASQSWGLSIWPELSRRGQRTTLAYFSGISRAGILNEVSQGNGANSTGFTN